MSVENVCMQIVKMTLGAYFKFYPHMIVLLLQEALHSKDMYRLLLRLISDIFNTCGTIFKQEIHSWLKVNGRFPSIALKSESGTHNIRTPDTE